MVFISVPHFQKMKKIKILKVNGMFFGLKNGWQEECNRVKGT